MYMLCLVQGDGQMVTVEFYRMAKGGSVGRILETTRLQPFASKHAFNTWARTELPLRRGGTSAIWEWPDAVRAVDLDGSELFRWTLWDQLIGGWPLVTAPRS
jgi:hypothetical protein